MRLWSLHPKYLDTRGLVALWREGLLAYHVLQGKTKGYTNHPQLIRFRSSADPIVAIVHYLHAVVDEAEARGYNFNRDKLTSLQSIEAISVTLGQLDFEKKHLLNKLAMRDPQRHDALVKSRNLEAHPGFAMVQGDIEPWEKI